MRLGWKLKEKPRKYKYFSEFTCNLPIFVL